MDANIFEKANQIIRSCGDAYLGVIDENGFPSVSTVSITNTTDILTAYFTTGINSNKVKRLQKDNRASLCFRSEGNNVTLVGQAEIITDQAVKDACWQDWFINHYSQGKTDPTYVVVKFTTKRVSLWVDCESAEFNIDQLLKIQSRCGLLCDFCGYKQSHGCGGCIQTKGNPFHGECPVAQCCQSKNLTQCGECNEIPCEKLHDYSCGEDEECDNPKGARIAVCHAWKNHL